MIKTRGPRKPLSPAGIVFRDHLWQPTKALLCAAQLYLLDILLYRAVVSLWGWGKLEIPLSIWAAVVRLVGQIILMYVLWHHYDEIDDISFFGIVDEPDPAPLLRRRTWLLNIMLGVVATAPCTVPAVKWVLSFTPLPQPLQFLIAVISGPGIFLAFRLIQVSALSKKWMVQRTMEDGTAQYYRLWVLILYSVVLFLALAAFLPLVIGEGLALTILSTLWSVVWLIVTECRGLLIAMATVVAVIWLICCIRLLLKQRKFLRRLMAMEENGVISFTRVGHPWLSCIFVRVRFGLLITHRNGTKYRVGVATTNMRALTAIACDHHTIQYMHQIRFRVAPVKTAVGVVQPKSEPMGTWYTTRHIRFPEGEGQDIMLMFPVPRVMAVRVGGRMDQLDNGSEVYGYTIYSQNAFCNYLERAEDGKNRPAFRHESAFPTEP